MMDDQRLRTIVQTEIEQSTNFMDDELGSFRIDAMKYYMGEPFGNEETGKSQVVLTEVADTIDFIMPSLMRIFATDEYVKFEPVGPEDVQHAQQATDYVNHVITVDNPGFIILHNWMKDALINKIGVVKHWWNDATETSEDAYEDLNEDEATAIASDDDVEVMEAEDEGRAMRVRRTRKTGRVKVETVPPEEFLVSRHAKSLQDASFVGHRTGVTVSDCLARGYPKRIVEKHAALTDDAEFSEERQARFDDIEQASGHDRRDTAMREVMVTECYIRVDYDGDGIAELRRVVVVGNENGEVVENDPWERVPFSVISPVLMPHRLIGRSVAELVMDVQKIKSTILRQMLDNLYLANNSRVAVVEGMVNLDDVMNDRPGGVIRMRQPGMVQPIVTPFVAKDAFPMMQYLDDVKETRTGISKASMGLDADRLQSTTQIGIEAMQSAMQGKIELIARIFAETGMKDMFRSILHLVTKHQDAPRMIRLRNTFVEMDPSQWDPDMDVTVTVGLGTGEPNKKMQMLMGIAAKQEAILQQLGPGNPLVSMQQYAATLRKLVELAGWKDTTSFFNAPEQVAQQQAMQAQQPQQQDPKAQAEAAKIQAEVQMMQAKAQMEAQQAAQKAQTDMQIAQARMEMEARMKREQMQMDAQLRREELTMEQQLRIAELQMKAQAGASPDVSDNLPRA